MRGWSCLWGGGWLLLLCIPGGAFILRSEDTFKPATFRFWRWMLLEGSPGTGRCPVQEVEVYSRPAPQVNLASVAQVRVSSNEERAFALTDGNLSTSWEPSSPHFPQWVQLSFEVGIEVERLVMVHGEGGHWAYRYRVEASSDGKNWQTIVPEKRVIPVLPSPLPSRLPLTLPAQDEQMWAGALYRATYEMNLQRGRFWTPLRWAWLQDSPQTPLQCTQWATLFALLGWAAVEPDWAEDTLRAFHRAAREGSSFLGRFLPWRLLPRWRHTEAASFVPFWPWVVWEVAEQAARYDWLEDAFPLLEEIVGWWSTERDVDGDGLIEVGAYDGSPKTARQETFPDKPTLAALRLTPSPSNPASAYGDVETVEGTVALILAEQALAAMAQMLGRGGKADFYRRQWEQRAHQLHAQMYFERDGFFFDLQRDRHEPLRRFLATGFLPLLTGTCTAAQKEALLRHLKDPRHFKTPFPVPTLAVFDPEFDSRASGRGAARLDLNYLLYIALRRTGAEGEAKELWQATQRAFEPGLASLQWDSYTGAPLGPCLSSAAGSMLPWRLEALYGLQRGGHTLAWPPAWKGLLRWGNLRLLHRPEERGLLLELQRRATLAFTFPSPWERGKMALERLEGRPERFAWVLDAEDPRRAWATLEAGRYRLYRRAAP